MDGVRYESASILLSQCRRQETTHIAKHCKVHKDEGDEVVELSA